MGLIPLDPLLTAHNVPLEITGISPATDFNKAGGEIITITGNNFPVSLSYGDAVNIRLSSAIGAGYIVCVP